MNAIYLRFVFVGILSFSTIVHAEGMCRKNEDAIFNCEFQDSTASLCKATDTGALVYRYGSVKKIDLEISDVALEKTPVFYFSNAPYSGGGEAHIRFSRGKYIYYLYDKTEKTDDGPQFSAGIVVYKNDEKIGHKICENNASIRQAAYDEMTKEAYRHIGSN